MFKQIVSQLSMTPQAASQLTFYARRLKQESITRFFSAFAAMLLVILQVVTVVSPASASNSASSNDLIIGGFSSKADLLSIYDRSPGLQKIYSAFNVTRSNISAAEETVTVNGKTVPAQVWSHEFGGSLLSVGHLPAAGCNPDTRLDVYPVNNGLGTVYIRHLSCFDGPANAASTNGSYYNAVIGKKNDGSFFAILKICGNIVVKTLPTPVPTPTPTPKPTPTPTPKPTATPISTPTPSSTPTPTSTPTSTPTPSASPSSTPKPTSTPTPECKPGVPIGSPECAPAQFTQSKTALNTTQNSDATKQLANPGDNITYNLITTNNGRTAGSYTTSDNIGDILEYAQDGKPNDLGGGTINGLIISWPSENINPGKSVVHAFTITVTKDPAVLARTISTSYPRSYDLKMDNVYGNEVSVGISPPASKVIETVSATMPQTGPGTSILIIFIIGAMIFFFYLRNRQLVTEIKILRNEYQGEASHVS